MFVSYASLELFSFDLVITNLQDILCLCLSRHFLTLNV